MLHATVHEPAKDSRESVDAPPFLRPQPLLLQSSVSSLGTTFQELLQLQVDGMHGTAPIAHGNCRDNNENGDSVPGSPAGTHASQLSQLPANRNGTN